MSFDRHEFAQLKEGGNGHDLGQQTLVQAQLSIEHVTSDPHWDRFLSYIQAAIEAEQGKEQTLFASLRDPGLVNHDQIMQVKIALAQCTAHIQAWQEVMAVPKRLKDGQ